MDRIEKSTSRKLRRLYKITSKQSWRSDVAYTQEIFRIGEFAAQLLPYWMETEHSDFQLYLYHRCGLSFRGAGKVALWALTYYEVPSLSVWLDVGWHKAAQAATRDQDGQREMLLESGLNVLDLMTLVR